MSRSSDLRRDLRWGIMWGLGFAAVYTFVAALIFAVEGQHPFEANDATLGEAIVGYVLGGLVGGVLLGLLRPLTARRWGAVFVGILVGVPAVGAVVLPIEGPPSAWDQADLFAVVVLGTILGAFGGNHYWKPASGPGDQAHPPPRRRRREREADGRG